MNQHRHFHDLALASLGIAALAGFALTIGAIFAAFLL